MYLKCILGLGNASRLLVVSADLEISISYHRNKQKRIFFIWTVAHNKLCWKLLYNDLAFSNILKNHFASTFFFWCHDTASCKPAKLFGLWLLEGSSSLLKVMVLCSEVTFSKVSSLQHNSQPVETQGRGKRRTVPSSLIWLEPTPLVSLRVYSICKTHAVLL